MNKKLNLIITDSYHNLFPTLAENLSDKISGLNRKNLIFCEEKISLMAERYLCSVYGGTFNTDVYSFGNYLRCKKHIDKTLSREGSAMAVKRILSNVALKNLNASKRDLAPTLYDVIVQLKSAKVSPDELLRTVDCLDGSLKNKIADIALVYSEYERFIGENNINDQSKILSYLPELLENDTEIEQADVVLLGYTSLTGQLRDAIKVLIKRAGSVTAILTGGDNEFLYLNETIDSIIDLANSLSVKVEVERVSGNTRLEHNVICQNIFNPVVKEKVNTNDICLFAAKDVYSEIQTVAQTIKSKVIEGKARYCDFSVAIPDADSYSNAIKKEFQKLDIPFFLDEKISPETHPLIRLIKSYIEVFDKNMEREALATFYKNPLFNTDKDLADRFYNHLLKFNINFSTIKKPFTVCSLNDNLESLERFRLSVCSMFERFNLQELFSKLDVENKLVEMTGRLIELGEQTQADINKQIFASVSVILADMNTLLDGVKLSYKERLKIFASGISALKLSIIPQFSDAVFVGAYREIALAKAEYLFAVGLTESVPNVKDDVAIISDDDINRLAKLKVLVEPKIKIVNERAKENLGMALCSFNKKLYLSRPVVDLGGKKTLKSIVLNFFDKAFTLTPYEFKNSFLTEKQGLSAFALACSDFSGGWIDDFSDFVAYYNAVGRSGKAKDLLDYANTALKTKLEGFDNKVVSGVVSPTLIEEYYKCPYRAFISKILRLKERENGKMAPNSLGLFLHEVFKNFLEDLDNVKDDASFEVIFASAFDKASQNPDYSKYLEDAETGFSFNMARWESRQYCYKTFKHFEKSKFRPKYLEKSFEYKLLNGKVKLRGNIDRVDTCKDYFRIIDYKTGSVQNEKEQDQLLFAGNKLQIYLYATAFKENKPAGLYYAKVNEGFSSQSSKKPAMMSGKTLDDLDAICLQDTTFNENGKSDFFKTSLSKDGLTNTTSEEVINAYITYAEKLCENAVEQLDQGTIPSSPFVKACDYCAYSGMCQKERFSVREVGDVNSDTILESVKGEEDKNA